MLQYAHGYCDLSPLSQVTLLSEGHHMYSGAPHQVLHWFESMQYLYNPHKHSALSDWLIDLVSVGFDKPFGFEVSMLSISQWHSSVGFDISYLPEGQCLQHACMHIACAGGHSGNESPNQCLNYLVDKMVWQYCRSAHASCSSVAMPWLINLHICTLSCA